MPALDLSAMPEDVRPIASWASALLVALARDEVAGRRLQRLTEPGLGTWARFRGRLTATDLLDLLFEDAAVLHRVPFDPEALDGSLRLDRLPAAVVDAWLAALPSLDLRSPGAEYIGEQARLLGIPTRLARSELHVVKRHQKVLELPGTGGQLAHHLVSSQKDLILQDNFVVACSTWQELTLAGLVALDCGAPSSDFATRVDIGDLRDPKHALRQRSFDFVIGLHPDKGGLFRIDDQLAIWFPNAKSLLV
ncbi:hypothetical protein ACMHYB_23490 [Sorangium sp. So ce1128]